MNINIILGNHAPCVHVQDQFEYVSNGLLAAGNHVALSYFDFLKRNGVNIFMENNYLYFYEHLASEIARYSSSKTFMIATEVIQKGSLNSANLDLKDGASFYQNKNYWTERTRQLFTLVPFLNGIIVVSEDLIDSYKPFGIPIFYLPLMGDGHSIKHNLEKDIDVLFTGTLTTHREKIKKVLENNGLRVEILNTNTPNYVRDNFFSRAKVGLGLKLSESTKLLSKFRAWYFLKNKIPCVFEGPVNFTDLNHYLPIFENQNEFIEEVIDTVLNSKNHMLDKFTKYEVDSQNNYLKVFEDLSKFLDKPNYCNASAVKDN